MKRYRRLVISVDNSGAHARVDDGKCELGDLRTHKGPNRMRGTGPKGESQGTKGTVRRRVESSGWRSMGLAYEGVMVHQRLQRREKVGG